MKKYIDKEEVFVCRNGAFAVAQTSAGYTLNYSTDGENFTAVETATPANEDLFVLNAIAGTYFKLDGNVDDDVLVKL